MKITIETGWTSDPMLPFDGLILELSQEEIDKIQMLSGLVKEHQLTSIKIPVSCDFTSDGEVMEVNDYRQDEVDMIIYQNSGYLYGQNRHDAQYQFESSAIDIKGLNIKQD